MLRSIILLIWLIINPLISISQNNFTDFDIVRFYKTLGEENDPQRKIEYCHQSLTKINNRLDPHYISILSMKGTLLSESGRFKEAETALSEVLTLYGEYQSKYFKNPQSLSELGKRAYLSHQQSIIETKCALASVKLYLNKPIEAVQLANYALLHLSIFRSVEERGLLFNLCYGILNDSKEDSPISDHLEELNRLKKIADQNGLLLEDGPTRFKILSRWYEDIITALQLHSPYDREIDKVSEAYRNCNCLGTQFACTYLW